MVKLETIDEIITRLLKNNSNLTVKCGPTIAEMKTKIDNMRREGTTFKDMCDELKDTNNLNPLEYDDYQSTLKEYDKIEKQWDKAKYGTEKYNQLFDRLMELEDYLFQYNRRLFQPVEHNTPPSVDTSNFKYDELSDDDMWEKNGAMETQQITHQQSQLHYGEKIDEYDEDLLGGDVTYHYDIYDDPRLIAMNNYFNGDCRGINYTISHEGYLKKLDNEQMKQVKDIDSLMEEGGGLAEDTLLFRGGYWDIHLNVGDHSNGFQGYQSATFLESVARDYVEHHEEQTDEKGMLIKILAPKGTKGIAGNDNRFMNGFYEHEYTLARNTGFTVVDIDYENMVATVLLDEPT